MNPTLLRGILCGIACLSLFSGSDGPGDAVQAAQPVSRLERAYADFKQLTESLKDSLQKLLAESVKNSDNDLTEQIEQKLDIARGEAISHRPLPRDIQPDIPFTLTAAQRSLRVQLRKTCVDTANQYYLLARRVQTESPTFAFELLNLVLQLDSDHASARSLRGYVRQGNEWMTPFERDQRRAGKVEHPRFGWLPAAQVEKYEQGERHFLGNWVTAAKEAEIRRDFRYAWEVQTEHFRIKTNVSLEQGVELGRKLETFHDYFKQTFALFYNSPEQLRQLFDETTGRARNRNLLHEVHFFRTKDEYVAKLQSRIPQIALTNGLYQLEDRVSYFYDDPERNHDATVFHEATHQLMYESHLKQRDVGRQAHFWIIEGIACYMESFQFQHTPEGISYSVGDPRFVRFYWARHRLLKEDYHPSLAIFARLGMVEFQTGTGEELQRRYSQASGLSHFFMHYDNGRYRDALMLHLAQLYHSNPRIQQQAQGLDVLTGVRYSTLDQQYREYLQEQELAVGKEPVIQ